MVALLPATQNRARLAIPGMVLGMYLCGLCRNQAARNDDYWSPPSSDLRCAPAGSGPRAKLWGIDTDNTEFHGPASIMTFERRLRSKASGVGWFLIDRGCEQQECNSPKDGIYTKDRSRKMSTASPRKSADYFGIH